MYIDGYIYMYILIGIPMYGPLLSSTDSDAVAWCLSWVTFQGDVNRGKKDEEVRGGGSGSVVSFNLSSTRNLVARSINLLNTCQSKYPSPERFKVKKTQCDALLVLCEMFSHV
jgi:hypothetical protein